MLVAFHGGGRGVGFWIHQQLSKFCQTRGQHCHAAGPCSAWIVSQVRLLPEKAEQAKTFALKMVAVLKAALPK
jgi:hypothetical protein